MSLGWQIAIIAGLLIAVYVLHRRARRENFERFRAYHSRRKYRIAVESSDEKTE